MMDFEEERHEVAALLACGIFSRAPSLAQLLSYICERHFEGQAGQIKEYNIAVEALGRPPDFDQKRDSIVRVEAHRLRKRLKEYYETDGAAHRIRILVPPGQYAPKFIVAENTTGSAELVKAITSAAIQPTPRPFLETVEGPPLEFSPAPPKKGVQPWMVFVAFGAIVLLIGVSWAVRVRTDSSAGAVGYQPANVTGETIRINAGASKPYTDRFGQVWAPDTYFHGGSAVSTPSHPVWGTRDPKLYQNRREGAFSYDIPLQPGSHELRLHFVEMIYGDANIAGGGETSRLFNVSANGKRLMEGLDLVSNAGPSNAHVSVSKDIAADRDGYLHLKFEPSTNIAVVSAIEISPGTPGRLRPIRIVARDQPYTDRSGQVWDADRYFRGGQQVLRPSVVSGTTEPEIYRGERFGNISYSIPVAKGRYAVILHFAETWFGPDKPQGGGTGSRLFDILCNGVALARGFDIYKVAGGCDRALTQVYHGVEASPQGLLVISLVPLRNYACVNAIEVLDESGGS
jgi:hypothetical protein